MVRYHYIQETMDVWLCLLFFGVEALRAFVIAGVLKLLVSVALGYLLFFVVVHRATICKMVRAGIWGSRSAILLVTYRGWVPFVDKPIKIANELSLSPLFQRPPPVVSL
jgi:hypothetical protein